MKFDAYHNQVPVLGDGCGRNKFFVQHKGSTTDWSENSNAVVNDKQYSKRGPIEEEVIQKSLLLLCCCEVFVQPI
jgi:hypothetical protein